jgi:hypothetical protein
LQDGDRSVNQQRDSSIGQGYFRNWGLQLLSESLTTTVQINRSTMSQVAVERLMARIEGEVSAPLFIPVRAG